MYTNPAKSAQLTAVQLRHILHLNTETGVFTWKNPSKFANQKPGDLAGCATKSGHWWIKINDNLFMAHRLVWLYITGDWPDGNIDHIDQNPNNNKFTNLRIASAAVNSRNHKKYKNNTSGCTGVFWEAHCNKWRPRIRNKGKMIHLGLFTDFFEACCIRKSAELIYYPELQK